MPARRLKTRPKKKVRVNLPVALHALYKRQYYRVWKLFKISERQLQLLCLLQYLVDVIGKKEIGITRLADSRGDNMKNRYKTTWHVNNMIKKGFLYDKEARNNGRGIGLSGLGKTIVKYYQDQMHYALRSTEEWLNIDLEYVINDVMYTETERALPESEVDFLVDFFNQMKEESQGEFLNRIIKEL